MTTSSNSSHWGLFGPGILSTGAPVMELPAQCEFGAMADKKGLRMTMGHRACRVHPKACCVDATTAMPSELAKREGAYYSVADATRNNKLSNNKFATRSSHSSSLSSSSSSETFETCVPLATCHMGAIPLYRYGTFEASVRFGHHKSSHGCAKNGLSFFSIGYTDAPVHNEITIGVDGKDGGQKLHFAYWYDATMRRHEVPVSYDLCGALHNYTVVWTPDSIRWVVNGVTLHVDRGVAGKTIPFLPLSTRFVLRPARENVFHDDIYIEYKSFKYTPLVAQ
jgi:hypothetical protein